MRLLIKFPTRGRKDKFFLTLDKYYEYCSDIDNTMFLISIDTDDTEMNTDEVINKLSTYKNIKVVIGYSLSKIDAVNRDLSDWCVTNIPSTPNLFESGTPAWSLPKPVWGTCPP